MKSETIREETVFRYKLSDAWCRELSQIRIIDDPESPIVSFFMNAGGMMSHEPFRVEHQLPISKDDLEKIKDLLDDPRLYEIEDLEYSYNSMVLDGYDQEFEISSCGRHIKASGSNIQECEDDMEHCLHSVLMAQTLEKIKKILVPAGIPEGCMNLTSDGLAESIKKSGYEFIHFPKTEEEWQRMREAAGDDDTESGGSGFDAPSYGIIIEDYPEGTIMKMDQDGVVKPVSPEEYEKEPKAPVQAFVANIVFPKSLDEVLEYSYLGSYNVEDILDDTETNWTVPNWAKIGDIVFFMHSKTAIQTIRKLCTELKNTDQYDDDDKEELQEWLDRGRELYADYGGKIYAYGRVSGNPEGMYDENEDNMSNIHWKARIYADIDRIHVLDNPIEISEFNDFLFISRCGSITPVYGTEFEKLKALILSKNNEAEDYFVDSMAAPVPLAKITEENWLSVTNEYRRSFLLEQQFRSFYVDRFLAVLGDRKTAYRECRCKKEGIPDSFVDNIILFNGKYLPIEVKLNIKGEVDLPGQVKKYCNADVRYTDHGAEKAIDNAKSYQNHVLIIDTENVYLYDDRKGIIEHIKNLDEIQTIEDIRKLRENLISLFVELTDKKKTVSNKLSEKAKANKLKYDREYANEHYKGKFLSFNVTNPDELELLMFMRSQPNSNQYVKDLIRADMEKRKTEKNA